VFVFLVGHLLWVGVSQAASNNTSTLSATTLNSYRAAITAMKEQPRGPFKRLRWFCADGSILPPKAGACREHGGGVQHGQWSDKTLQLRNDGFMIGNVLAATNPSQIVDNYTPDGELQAILIEQFLIDINDGWIFKKARSYRGAFQIEDEQAAGLQILKALSSQSAPIENRYLLILEAFKRLPFASENESLINKVRTSATNLNNKDEGFSRLRNSIHGKLSADVANRVRAYADDNQSSSSYQDMLELANDIDQIFSPGTIEATLLDLAKFAPSEFQTTFEQWKSSTNEQQRFDVLADAMFKLRTYLQQNSESRFEGFQLVARLEQAAFSSGSLLRKAYQQKSNSQAPLSSRQNILAALMASQRMLYGVGLLTDVEFSQASKWIQNAAGQRSVDNTTPPLTLDNYQSLLRNLERIPVWSERRVQFFFGDQVKRLSNIEPLTVNYVPDRLRGSSMVFLMTK